MRRGVLEFWWTCSRSTQKEKIGILPLWKAGFTGMPSNLWVSLECPYQRCPSRYNAISAHLTSSQNLQLIFLTWMDAYAPASISYPVPPLSHGTPVTPCFCTAPVPCTSSARRQTTTPTAAWVASRGINHLRKNPNTGPKDLKKKMQKDHKCEIHYDTVWTNQSSL